MEVSNHETGVFGGNVLAYYSGFLEASGRRFGFSNFHGQPLSVRHLPAAKVRKTAVTNPPTNSLTGGWR